MWSSETVYSLLLFTSTFEWNGYLALLGDFYALCGATSLHNGSALSPLICMLEAWLYTGRALCFFINTYLMYVYTHLQLWTVEITVNHLLHGHQAGHHPAHCTAEQSPYSNTHTGLRKWKCWSSTMSLLPKTYISEPLCLAFQSEVTSTRCHQPSGTCSPAHSFGVALSAAGGGGAGVDGCGEASWPQYLLQGCRPLPSQFHFVCSFCLLFLFSFCFPAFFATSHFFSMFWINTSSTERISKYQAQNKQKGVSHII